MYRPITMYQIVCDRCGEVFGGTDTCSALFSNKEVDIGDYSDWEMIDGKHYCPDCYEVEVIDGVYSVKAKEILSLRLLWLYAMANSFLVFSKILRIFSQQTGRRCKDEEE